MYLWRKRATAHWFAANQATLSSRLRDNLTVIEFPGHKRLCLEAACGSKRDAQALIRQFGGQVEKLPRDWLRRFSSRQKTKPLKIGNQIVISSAEGPLTRHRPVSHLCIPAGAAVGTGQHATTAMSLRLLHDAMRLLEAEAHRAVARARTISPNLIVDLGTGSGILALAARRLGAKRVVGLDIDPSAISTAKKNARLNRIDHAEFRLGNVRRWKIPPQTDVVAANLFVELLIEILPKLRGVPWLILSGVMRDQESELTCALKRANIKTLKIRRRGKWIAVLAKGYQVSKR